MATSDSFTLTSPAFVDNSSMPAKYTCDGEGVSAPLAWSGPPEGTRSFVLIAEDPDVPKALMPSGLFVHWVVYDIPASTHEIPEGGLAGSVGENGAGKSGYAPACPPREYEPREHRYIFTLYALDTFAPSFLARPGKDTVVRMMKGHILAEAVLTGRYKRP